MKCKYLVCLVIASLLMGLWGCEAAVVDNKKKAEQYNRNHMTIKKINMGMPNFVLGNDDIIIFDYSTVFWSKIATFNLKNGEFKEFNIQIKHVKLPAFSPDGKKIAFLGALDEYGYNRNIYIMNADGSKIRQITNFDFSGKKDGNLETANYVRGFSFSPDGKRIIYVKAIFKRERAYPLRGIMFTAWDIYELDMATGNERRLTNYNFYEMFWPHYMPDGKRFIFSAEGPVNTKGSGPKDFREYGEMYQKNFIFIMDGINNELKPAFTYGNNSAKPCVMPNGAIIFLSETSAKDSPKATQDLFIYKKGRVKRLTQLDSWIGLARVSSDGKRIMFSKRTDKKIYDYSNWLMNSDGTGLKEIKIPLNLLKK